jgi:hypothetical protein
VFLLGGPPIYSNSSGACFSRTELDALLSAHFVPIWAGISSIDPYRPLESTVSAKKKRMYSDMCSVKSARKVWFDVQIAALNETICSVPEQIR